MPAASPFGSQALSPHTATVAIIPARYHSSRLPGKALMDIGGRSMIEHVYRRVAAAQSVARVLVATDDERIRAAVEAFGGTAVLTLASHHTGTDRLAEVAAHLDCELVINVQGDEPLVEPPMIDEAVAPLAADGSLVMATLKRRIEDPVDLHDPNVVKVVTDGNGDALYFSRAPIPFRRANDPSAALGYKHIGLYAYRRAFLLEFARLTPGPLERAESLEQLRALEYGFRIKVIQTAYDSIGVDTLEDLERVRRIAEAAARV